MISDVFKKDDMHLIASICWSLWRNRNEIVWNQRGNEFVQVVESAKQIFNQWKEAQDMSFDYSLGFLTLTDGKERWTKSKEECLKINVDAVVFTKFSCFSFAFLIGNSHGAVMEAFSSCRSGVVDPEFTEAMGIGEVLSWIKKKNVKDVEIEMNCLVAMQAIRCSTVTLSYFGRVVDDCKLLLSQLKQHNVVLNFVKRSANKMTREIAKHSSSIADRIWSDGDVHQLFYSVLQNDLNV